LDFASYPLEIQYFGVMGEVLDDDRLDLATTVEHTPAVQSAGYVTPYRLRVDLRTEDGQWVPTSSEMQLTTVGELKSGQSQHNFDVRDLLLGVVKPPLPLERYGGLYKTAVMNSKLQTQSAVGYRLVLELVDEGASPTGWTLTDVSLEAYIASDTEVGGKALQGVQTSHLRACISDPAFFSKINKAIVELTTRKDISASLRLTACQFLHKIIKAYPCQAQAIAGCLDLPDFIRFNIYQQDKTNVATALDLLQQLSVVPELGRQVSEIIIHDIAVVPSIRLSSSGMFACSSRAP
jgi:hypothetical protein